MKKALLFLTTLFSVVLLHAQTESNPYNLPLSNEEFFKQAEFVFEGYAIKTVAGYDPAGNGKYTEGYRIDSYKVLRVYKGTQFAAGDTIYMVQKGWSFELENYESIFTKKSDHSGISYDLDMVTVPAVLWKNGIQWNPKQEEPLIHFIVSSDFPDDENSKYFSYKKYKSLHKQVMYICGDIVAGLNNLNFRQREDFYNYMKQFEGFTVPEPEPLPVKQLKN
jgi:hypothetical protein